MLRDINGNRLEKRCSKCGEWKTLDSFDLDRSRKDDRTPACKLCRKEQRSGGRNE